MVAAVGCFTQSITVTTVYATLGMDAVVEAIVDNSIPLVVCNRSSVAKILEKASKMPTLTHVVYTNDLVAPGDVGAAVPAKQGKVKVVSFDEFCASGDTQAYPPTPPKADTCAVVMYTSGSTGKPKGVVVTHRQYVELFFFFLFFGGSPFCFLLSLIRVDENRRLSCAALLTCFSSKTRFFTLFSAAPARRVNAVVAGMEVALPIRDGKDVYVRDCEFPQ
jgi:acyl-CoA synthetase (AMP-forming)/AMP-acid ligase II